MHSKPATLVIFAPFDMDSHPSQIVIKCTVAGDPTPDVQLRTPNGLLDKVQAEDSTAGSQTYTYTINVYSQQHLGN